ncbi:hypothetical protein [Mucilaginibacter sp. UYCu711]|uniref:hypothetical protein n=1 Tax=Mucilaginibacter sp. UYCu711 TaxID=3156339 RepID=UPI003D1B392C
METDIKKRHHRLLQLDPELYMRLQDERRLEVYFDSFFYAGTQDELLDGDYPETRYDYIAAVLEEEFPAVYLLFSEAGILRYELINLAAACAEDLGKYGFPADPENRLLRYEVTGSIDEYLKGGPQNGV